MRIDVSGLHPNQRPTAGCRGGAPAPQGAPGREGGDQVTVSGRARLLASAQVALREAPAVRSSVVEQARLRLLSDATSLDGQAIASAMIDTIAGDRS